MAKFPMCHNELRLGTQSIHEQDVTVLCYTYNGMAKFPMWPNELRLGTLSIPEQLDPPHPAPMPGPWALVPRNS